MKELPKYVSESMSGCLGELKNKGKDQLVTPESGRGRLWEQSLTRAFDYRVQVTIRTGGGGRNYESLDCIWKIDGS